MAGEMANGRQPAIGLIASLLAAALSACVSSDGAARGCGLDGSSALPEPTPRLVFACNVRPPGRYHGDIVLMAPGQPAKLLTHGEGWNYSPRWSPDGSHILFGSTRTGVEELYLMNADGSGVVQLTRMLGFVGDSSWSPDGTQIAFSSSAAG